MWERPRPGTWGDRVSIGGGGLAGRREGGNRVEDKEQGKNVATEGPQEGPTADRSVESALSSRGLGAFDRVALVKWRRHAPCRGGFGKERGTEPGE